MRKTLTNFILIVIFFSCKNDDVFYTGSNIENLTDEQFASENFGEEVVSNFIGRVVNQDGNQVKDVLIVVGDQITTTDHNGIFVINNALVNKKFAFVKATKENYIQGSRTIVPTQNGTNDIQITLLEKTIVGSVNSGSNSEVSLPNGSKVEFQGAFIDSNGYPYSGQVDVSMHYLEPNKEATFSEMPGMLFGMRENRSASSMETYGMLAINLFSPNGEQLNILESSPATLTFPIATSTPNTSEDIPLWYFDEEVGYWKEQGVANKIGTNYIAEVTHFSWWNCDIPLDYIQVCFALQMDNGTTSLVNNLTNYFFEIKRDQTNQIIYSGYTNSVGEECGLFPENETVTINVFGNDSCLDQVIHSESFGSYSSDTSITINIPYSVINSAVANTTITGNILDCSNNPITNGYAIIFDSNSTSFSFYNVVSITNGTINYDFNYCISGSHNIMFFDLDTNQLTNQIAMSLTPSTTDLGNVSICGNTIGDVYVGDIEISNQQDLETFAMFDYSEIQGKLSLSDDLGATPATITSLLPLSALQKVESLWIFNSGLQSLVGLENLNEVTNELFILDDTLITLNGIQGVTTVKHLGLGCPLLVSLEGLENLNEIENDFDLRGNNSLLDLSGLDNLSSIGGTLDVYSNQSMQSLTGMLSMNSLNRIDIEENSSLTSLLGLNVINANNGMIGTITVQSNDALVSLNGLEGFQTVGSIILNINPSLFDISALSSLTTITTSLFIRRNHSLVYLDGLENLTSVTNLHIGSFSGCVGGSQTGGNNNLSDFCALTYLITNGIYSDFCITSNAFNPTVQDIIDGNCRL